MLDVQGHELGSYQYAIEQRLPYRGNRRKQSYRDAVTESAYRIMKQATFESTGLSMNDWLEQEVKKDLKQQGYGIGWIAILTGLAPIIAKIIEWLVEYWTNRPEAVAALRG